MSQEEEIYLNYEDLIEENDLDESQFSERLQQKIEQIQELCDEFDECEEEEEEELLLRIKAMDDGICADLSSIIAKMREDDEKEQAENANNQTASNGGQTESNPESPSWRFWM